MLNLGLPSKIVAKPILRWAGSKRLLVPKLSLLAPSNFSRYVEPFCGSACLFLAADPEKAILADLNPKLIATYETIRSHPHKVSEMLETWIPNKDTYLKIRQQGRSSNRIWNAASFLFLNRKCFNGVYRENLKGEFNVPYGGDRTGKLPSVDDLLQFAAALQKAELRCADFEEIVDLTENEDFLYLDPPYHYENNRNRGEYGYGAFSDIDIDRLTSALKRADARGVKILVSYNRCHLLLKGLPGWKLSYCTARRSVAGFSSARRTVREYQIRNY